MAKESVTIKANGELINIVRDHYKKYIVPNSGEYINFLARTKTIIVTGYNSSKEDCHKITFVGEGALNEARQFDSNCELNEEK
ncbi:MAG: DUF3378 domain-containing protein, partial [Bacilli bacterium]|nr:DUF3378 domain-containing protein [Bacilli bacterium]